MPVVRPSCYQDTTEGLVGTEPTDDTATGICLAELPTPPPELGYSSEQPVEHIVLIDRRAILRLACNMNEQARLPTSAFGGRSY